MVDSFSFYLCLKNYFCPAEMLGGIVEFHSAFTIVELFVCFGINAFILIINCLH